MTSTVPLALGDEVSLPYPYFAGYAFAERLDFSVDVEVDAYDFCRDPRSSPRPVLARSMNSASGRGQTKVREGTHTKR